LKVMEEIDILYELFENKDDVMAYKSKCKYNLNIVDQSIIN